MEHEKHTIRIHRLTYLSLLLICILFPSITEAIITYETKEVKIVEDSCYINEYYEYIDETYCTVEIKCNYDIGSGYATVAFYDNENNELGQERGCFYGTDGTLSSSFFIVGQVDSYEIVDYEFEDIVSYQLFGCKYESDQYMLLMLGILIICFIVGVFSFAFLISSLLLSCKKYTYYGDTIVVYAGFFHHYIKLNGVKVDEFNTLITFSLIYLSSITDDGARLEAVITPQTHRIKLKINDRLYQPDK